MTDNTRITVHINNKHILEELFNNDQEAILVIKEKVMQQFASSTLRPKFDMETADYMKNKFTKDVRSIVRKTVNEEINMEEIESYVKKLVSSCVTKFITHELDDFVNEKVKEAIKKQISKIKI